MCIRTLSNLNLFGLKSIVGISIRNHVWLVHNIVADMADMIRESLQSFPYCHCVLHLLWWFLRREMITHLVGNTLGIKHNVAHFIVKNRMLQ